MIQGPLQFTFKSLPLGNKSCGCSIYTSFAKSLSRMNLFDIQLMKGPSEYGFKAILAIYEKVSRQSTLKSWCSYGPCQTIRV